ncbi:MAG: porin [Sphingomonadales bacterium]|jgi:phosphate-selective porin OprO/OprP
MMRLKQTLALSAATALMTTLAFAAQPVQAQTMEEQMQALLEQMKAMQAEITELKRQQADAKAARTELATRSAIREAPKAQNDAVEIKAKGAPQFISDDFTFKVRGRLMVDFGQIEGAEEFGDAGLGTTTEIRRGRLGAEGAYGDWAYKFEVDYSNNEVSVADANITWKGPVEVTIGHQHLPNSLEARTSSRFISFMERAGFTSAFGLSRDTGVSVKTHGKNYVLQAGVYSNGGFSGDDEANGYSFGGRAVFNPKLGENQLHFGAWGLYRDKGAQPGRYRERPLLHTTDTRFINTGNIGTESDYVFGLEAAGIFGPFYVSSEFSRLTADLEAPLGAGLDDEFKAKGAYLQAGYFFTGESRGYKQSGGTFDRVKPLNPISKGGFGALALNAGFDYVDLNDADSGIIGGKQTSYVASLIWTPENYLRFIMQYGHADIDDVFIDSLEVGGIDSFGMRAQIDW